MWIVTNAIWVYNLTVDTGRFDVLRRSFASITLVCGLVVGVAQYVASNFLSIPLTDVVVALASALAVLVFSRI
ncbi:MAG: hypothetical protein ABS81_17680 [Pseudonocardia sp. SCN 72-86]|nr:MAG: hypothetical protein ABS81_17680 [Pseudonocardia sp. SCN 72-86]